MSVWTSVSPRSSLLACTVHELLCRPPQPGHRESKTATLDLTCTSPRLSVTPEDTGHKMDLLLFPLVSFSVCGHSPLSVLNLVPPNFFIVLKTTTRNQQKTKRQTKTHLLFTSARPYTDVQRRWRDSQIDTSIHVHSEQVGGGTTHCHPRDFLPGPFPRRGRG